MRASRPGRFAPDQQVTAWLLRGSGRFEKEKHVFFSRKPNPKPNGLAVSSLTTELTELPRLS
jgi:hypothetical protein